MISIAPLNESVAPRSIGTSERSLPAQLPAFRSGRRRRSDAEPELPLANGRPVATGDSFARTPHPRRSQWADYPTMPYVEMGQGTYTSFRC